MATHRLSYTWSNGGAPLAVTVEKTAGAEINIEEAISANQTNLAITLALDVSAMKSLVISSDVAMTLKTNSSGSPADTINLTANVPIVWHATNGFANILTTDVTVLYVTNTAAGTLKLYALQDVTP